MERSRAGAESVNEASEDAERSVDVLLEPDPGVVTGQWAAAGERLAFLDLFKGFIVALMAVDHVKHVFAPFGEDPVPFELYYEPADYVGSFAWWMTRAITHTVAVGFCLALGMGFFFLFRSRCKLGWGMMRLLRHYAVRAAVLVVLEQVLMQFMTLCMFIRGQWQAEFFYGLILTMLATVMVVGCVLMLGQHWLNRLTDFPWGDVMLAVTALFALVVSDALVRLSLPWGPGFVFPLLAWLAGPCVYSGAILMDAWLPWLPVVLLGLLLARRNVSTASLVVALIVAASLFALFRPLYVAGVIEFGSYRPIRTDLTGYSFFGMSKYPPSLTFLSWWLSVDLLLVLAFKSLPESWHRWPPLSWLLVLGRAPLFFYALHIVVYNVIGLPFAVAGATSLPGIYVEWALGLVLCYYPTKLFGRFKLSTSKDSLWRLF